MVLVRRCAFYDGWQLAHAAVAGMALSRDMNAANDFDGLTSSGAGTGLESVSEYPPLGAVKADTAKGLEDSGLEVRRLRKLARAYQMVTGLSIEITPEQKVVATMENEKHSDRCIQVTIILLLRRCLITTLTLHLHASLSWILTKILTKSSMRRCEFRACVLDSSLTTSMKR